MVTNDLLITANANKSLELHMALSIFHYVDIQLEEGLISIENRQAYCDRGKYIVKVFPTNVKKLYVDEADMFPRYYFKFENLISEIDCWILKRKLNVISVEPKELKHDE